MSLRPPNSITLYISELCSKLNASSNWRGRGCEYIGIFNTMHTCLWIFSLSSPLLIFSLAPPSSTYSFMSKPQAQATRLWWKIILRGMACACLAYRYIYVSILLHISWILLFFAKCISTTPEMRNFGRFCCELCAPFVVVLLLEVLMRLRTLLLCVSCLFTGACPNGKKTDPFITGY